MNCCFQSINVIQSIGACDFIRLLTSIAEGTGDYSMNRFR